MSATDGQFYVLRSEINSGACDYDTVGVPDEDRRLTDAFCCPDCGAPVSLRTWLPPCVVHMEFRRAQLSDFVPGTHEDCLISDRFAKLVKRKKLIGFSGFDPVRILRSTGRYRKLAGTVPPAYFRVRIARSAAAVNVRRSGIDWDEPPTCRLCRQGTLKRWRRVVLEPEPAPVEDVFTARGLPGTVLVTQRFREGCTAAALSNLEFIPAEEYGYDFDPEEKMRRKRRR